MREWLNKNQRQKVRLLDPRNKVLNQSSFEFLMSLRYIPNARIEGTHNPIKEPSALKP